MPLPKDVLVEVGKNALMAVPAVRRWRLTKPRAGMQFDGSPAQLDRYVYDQVKVVADVVGSLEGKRIAEIGPGDFLSACLAMLASGAASYTSIDRFMGDYSRPDGKAWYRGVRDSWTARTGTPWPSDLDPDRFPESYPDRVKTINEPIETANAAGQFDVVCSVAVGEHVNDIHGFALANARLLAPGGIAVHRVDFGPHDVWRTKYEPTRFLRFPEPVWRAMGSTRGYPNRRRVHEMVEAFESAGLEVEVRDVEMMQDVDPAALHPRYRTMPVESVATKLATIVARRAPDQTG